MTKNVSVIDETGKIIGTTYPKRARGLVNSGRARYVSCDSKDTICLTCPPDKLEDNSMTDKSLENATTNTLVEAENPVNAGQNAYAPSAEYALRMLEAITLDTEAIKQAAAKVSDVTDNGVAHIIDAREATNRELIKFYTQMYNEYKPSGNVTKSNAVAKFEEIAEMLKGLKKEDYNESAWDALMEAAKAQLSKN